ncbi:DUF5682 family protein [Actinoplanes sp. NPDC051851]|uniref:DUF5682 family protein n=1 Tax=Actinoplanes sp. NPDC051851 TaxID=3154753 RepID=UPI00342B8264
MSLTVIGVRHHSPACARLVEATIAVLRPAYVLVEGPAEMNGRIGELLLEHELPVAVFTSYADAERRHGSWAPFCAYSPEWVALRAGRDAGAELRFIDLPAWHEAFADRSNRYADAELRYAEAIDRLCAAFGVDNTDALWDHLIEMEPAEGLAERLAAYFELIRGEAAAGGPDTIREAYMARWIRAALRAADGRPVVAVVGGFHRPALLRLAAPAGGSPSAEIPVGGGSPSAEIPAGGGEDAWPEIPAVPEGASAGSYLVPYSFRRLDAFGGYQSGMPSPEYYQRLWADGPLEAGRYLMTAVAGRLRKRGQPVSTADLIAARATAEALSRLRGHGVPARVDVLDGLASALVNEALDVPLPWSVRGTLTAGQHPAVVEMTAALSGERVGRLHADTPLPPLVHAATAELSRYGLDEPGERSAELLEPEGRARSRVLHRLRVLEIPGYARTSGPATGIDPVLVERWTVRAHEHRLVALIEAGGYGTTLESAAASRIGQRVDAATGDLGRLADALFDAALCGVADLPGDVPERLARGVAAGTDPAELGRVLSVTLALWRHDRLLGTAGSGTLAAVVASATRRILWLADGLHGAGETADVRRIRAVVAVRDALLHGPGPGSGNDSGAGPGADGRGSGAGRPDQGIGRTAAREVADRIAADRAAPPDLRGAFFGLSQVLAATALPGPAEPGLAEPGPAEPGPAEPGPAEPGLAEPEPAGPGPVWPDTARAVRGAFAGGGAGDWLAGLFAVARESVLAPGGILGLLDELVGGLGADDFLVALPALRQAFEFFPPREREAIAEQLLARRGIAGAGRDLLRSGIPAEIVAAGLALDELIEERLTRSGLIEPVTAGAAMGTREPGAGDPGPVSPGPERRGRTDDRS